MDVSTSVEGNTLTLSLAGKLTVQGASEFHAALKDVPAQVRDIDIDLAEVSYVSSAGLREFVLAGKTAAARGGAMRLLHPRDEVMDVLEMIGLADVFTIER